MIELYTRVGDRFFSREDNFFQYPGGEWDLKASSDTFVGDEYAIIRGTNPEDYIKAGLWVDACKEYPTIIVPYLPAARADKGTPRGANVYANLIPNYRRLVTLDAHSDYMLDYLRDTHGDDVVNVPAWHVLPSNYDNFQGIIAPDEGAIQRALDVGNRWQVPVYYAKKSRDFATGKLLMFEPPEDLPNNKKLLVVDDICDGGGTFMGLAQAIRDRDFDVELHLFVTHGIFSKGISELRTQYKSILTTDSLDNRASKRGGWGAKVRPIKSHLLRVAYRGI